MSKWIAGFLVAAPLSVYASPLTLRTSGSYQLENRGSAISHSWQNSVHVDFDQKIVLDRVKKESCVGEKCESYELLTELTAREMPDDMLTVEVTFTNSADGTVSRLTGETKMRNREDSGKIELKSEKNGKEHFSIHLSPVRGA